MLDISRLSRAFQEPRESFRSERTVPSLRGRVITRALAEYPIALRRGDIAESADFPPQDTVDTLQIQATRTFAGTRWLRVTGRGCFIGHWSGRGLGGRFIRGARTATRRR